MSRTNNLARADFSGSTAQVAERLLGKLLLSQSPDGLTIGRVVETEAYLPNADPACHAAKHRTARTEIMFDQPGMAYVYPIHSRVCFNVVTEKEGLGAAVLIRAIEPIAGVELMQQRRGISNIRLLASGPSRLCQALAITRRVNGKDLTLGAPVWFADDGYRYRSDEISNTVRIGVTSAQQLKLRFVIRNSPFASGPAALRR